jgi:hypothetical protein
MRPERVLRGSEQLVQADLVVVERGDDPDDGGDRQVADLAQRADEPKPFQVPCPSAAGPRAGRT